MTDTHNIYLIPDEIPCPYCSTKFPVKSALYLLGLYAWIICSNCQAKITKEDVGPYLGVIKNVQ